MSSQKIGRYEVQRELGRGGMAVVYLAYDPYVKRQVAIKLLPRQFTFDPQFRARFQREAEVIAALEHPFIVPVHDFGGLDDQPFIVMRYMPGGSLLDRVRTGPLPLAEVARVVSRLAEALDAAHSQGIIHRDIKPGNILFDGRGQAYLSDFGIAKISESSAALTGTGMIGTPEYMSPEQARGVKDLDGRSDVYSLAVVIFQALTGKLPFRGENPLSMAMAHITQPVPNIRAFKPDLPSQVETISPRGMAKEPRERYRTAGELVQDLNRVAQQTEPRPGVSQATVYEPYVQPPVPPTAPPPPVGPTMPPPMVPTPAPQYPVTPPAPPQPRGGAGRTLAVMGGVGLAGVLVIGCCIGLLAMGGLGGLFGTATPAATATLAFVPTDTPAPTVTEAPSDTPVPDVTDTPVPPAPAGNVSASEGDTWPAVLVDDFESDSGKWLLGSESDEYADINRSITDGYYQWDLTTHQGLVSQLGPDMDSVGDVYVSVDARLLSGPPDSEYGIRLRYDGNNYYIFMVNEGQQYAFFLRNNDTWTTLIDWTDSQTIRPGEFNRVAAAAEGSSFVFFINGEQVDSTTDSTLASGKPGMAVELYGEGTQAVYKFDNFQVRQAWPLIINDSFDDNANNWSVGPFDDPRVQAQWTIGGTYQWDATALDGFTLHTNLDSPSTSDQYVAVDARRVSGPADAPFGLIFRYDGDNYYYFKISDDGYFQFAVLLNNEWKNAIDWTATDAIRHGDWNRLAVVAQGSHFTLYVNGQQVGEADDSQVTSGTPGLAVELFNKGDQGVVEFDNFEVRAP